MEGIGSTFQWRKPSFITAHLLNGTWFGNLTNAHDIEEGDQSAYFGLIGSHCDLNTLKIYQYMYPRRFIIVRATQNIIEYASKVSVKNTTVLVFDVDHLDQQHNYMVFDDRFKNNFHAQRLRRQTPKRKTNDLWVSIHFRWGDVKTTDVDKPNVRAGLGLTDYCQCVNEILSMAPSTKVFLFAEGLKDASRACTLLESRSIFVSTDSQSWRRDIDIMSQSQLLIGGSSSFFVLGAHLCQNCTVIHNSAIKFSKSSYEKNLNVNQVELLCQSDLQCYLEKIKNYMSKRS